MRATGITELRRIERQRHFGPGNVDARRADAVGRAVAEREAAARQADAAEHRGQRDRRPVGLLAMVRALQRPRAGDHAAGRRPRGARDRGWCRRRRRVIAAAQSASFGDAVVERPADSGGKSRSRCSGAPRNAASWRSSTSSVCAIASIIAVSVLGRIGIHCAPRNRARRICSGLTDTNSMPASLARRSHDLQRVQRRRRRT